MGSTIGQRIDYNGVGALERPAAHTQQKLTQVTPPGPSPRRLRDQLGRLFFAVSGLLSVSLSDLSKAVFIYTVRSPRFIPSPCFKLSP